MNNVIPIVMIAAMVMNTINKTGTAVKRMMFCSSDVGLEGIVEVAITDLLVLVVAVV